jgi:hypothetical protein
MDLVLHIWFESTGALLNKALFTLSIYLLLFSISSSRYSSGYLCKKKSCRIVVQWSIYCIVHGAKRKIVVWDLLWEWTWQVLNHACQSICAVILLVHSIARKEGKCCHRLAGHCTPWTRLVLCVQPCSPDCCSGSFSHPLNIILGIWLNQRCDAAWEMMLVNNYCTSSYSKFALFSLLLS